MDIYSLREGKMKWRKIKKHAKARHTYGCSQQGLRMEMKEISSWRFLTRQGAMRFYCHWWNYFRKRFRKVMQLPKNKAYSFFLCSGEKERQETLDILTKD